MRRIPLRINADGWTAFCRLAAGLRRFSKASPVVRIPCGKMECQTAKTSMDTSGCASTVYSKVEFLLAVRTISFVADRREVPLWSPPCRARMPIGGDAKLPRSPISFGRIPANRRGQQIGIGSSPSTLLNPAQ